MRALTALMSSTEAGLSTLAMTANRRKPGNDFAQQFESLAARSDSLQRQTGDVAARPREAGDEAAPTGSLPIAKTIGMVEVACFAAMTAGAPAGR